MRLTFLRTYGAALRVFKERADRYLKRMSQFVQYINRDGAGTGLSLRKVSSADPGV